jgi:hypothetical protein
MATPQSSQCGIYWRGERSMTILQAVATAPAAMAQPNPRHQTIAEQGGVLSQLGPNNIANLSSPLPPYGFVHYRLGYSARAVTVTE